MSTDAPSANGASSAAEPRARAPKARRDPIDAALPPAVDVHRFEEREKAALAPYLAAIGQAQQQLQMAFTLFVSAKGVDLDKVDVQLTPDGAGWFVRPKQPGSG